MRTTKQALYGGVYLAIILLLLTWLFFFFVKPAPSCFDKKQNQDEEGIDCGGICSPICLPANLQPVATVDDVTIFFPTADKVTALGRIKNPNDSHGAYVSYVITLYDATNKAIATVPQNTILYPGKVRYVIVSALELPNARDIIQRADIRFTKVDWQLAELLPEPQVVIRDQAVEKLDNNFLSIKGNVTNSDIVDIPNTTVIAVFFNQFNISIGAARTELANLRSGETREFTIIHPMLPSLQTQKTQVFLITD